MGGGASTVTHEDAKKYPQYHILGGESKWAELKGEEEHVALEKISDPYLAYGGRYAEAKSDGDFVYVEFDELPNYSLEHGSVARKVLTHDNFNKYKEVRTPKGYTFSNAIMASVVAPQLKVGVTAGDEESYALFGDFLHAVVRELHGHDAKENPQPKDTDASKLKFPAELHEQFKRVVTKVRVRGLRNFSGFAFPAGTGNDEREAVENLVKECVTALPEDVAGEYHALESLHGSELAQQLHDSGLLFQKPRPDSVETSCGAARNWPANRGLFVTSKHDAAIWVNHRDHVRVIVNDTEHADVAATFARWVRLTGALEKQAEAHGHASAWDDHFGYLSTDPLNLGTGVKVTVEANLPHLSAHPLLLEAAAKGFDLQAGVGGPNGKVLVSTTLHVGVTEVQVAQTLIDGFSRLLAYEHLLHDGGDEASVLVQLHQDVNTLAIKTIFVGPPGSGKGTQAPRIKNEYHLAHLSTGDMLREAVAKGTELGLVAKSVMESGKLVSDELVAQIVSAAIQGDQCKHGFILDGFPRTGPQAVILDSLLAQESLPTHPSTAIDCVINLVVADEMLIRRITGRVVHPPSGRSYNIYFNPPKVDGVDDVTGEALVKRGDDTEEKLRTRLEEFHEKTKPVLDHYAAKVVDIPADGDMEAISGHIRTALTKIKLEKLAQVHAHYRTAAASNNQEEH